MGKTIQEYEGFLERLGKKLDNANIWYKRIAALVGIIVAVVGVTVTISNNLTSALDTHIEAQTTQLADAIDANNQAIQNNSVELEKIRRDTLRVQLVQYIYNEPDAHDTILKLAYTYFVEYHGDWVMTDKFKQWAKSEGVEIPFDLNH